MTTITDRINNKNWALSRTGGIVVGIDDVKDCISNILTTQKGSLPLQPNYGCGIYDNIDGPLNVVRPKITLDILKALQMFEPRISVDKILSNAFYESHKSGINFDIYCKLANGEEFIANYQTVTSDVTPVIKKLTLQAPYSGISSGRYFIGLTLNDITYPAPAQGFSTISDLWIWVQNNWVTLGQWTFTADKIILNVIANAGTLTINGLSGVQALIPTLSEDEYFIVFFNGQPSPDSLLFNIEDLMSYVLTNWGAGGVWTTDGEYLIYTPTNGQSATLSIQAAVAGGFSNGFNNGYN